MEGIPSKFLKSLSGFQLKKVKGDKEGQMK